MASAVLLALYWVWHVHKPALKIQNEALNFDLARLSAKNKYGCLPTLQRAYFVVMKMRDSGMMEDFIASFINVESIKLFVVKPDNQKVTNTPITVTDFTQRSSENRIAVHLYAKKTAKMTRKLSQTPRLSLANFS